MRIPKRKTMIKAMKRLVEHLEAEPIDGMWERRTDFSSCPLCLAAGYLKPSISTWSRMKDCICNNCPWVVLTDDYCNQKVDEYAGYRQPANVRIEQLKEWIEIYERSPSCSTHIDLSKKK